MLVVEDDESNGKCLARTQPLGEGVGLILQVQDNILNALTGIGSRRRGGY